MGIANTALWVVGVVLIAVGYSRARVPWGHYQALRKEQANQSRYNAWRGGVRDDDAQTGAAVAMSMYRRQAQQWGVLAIAGVVAVFFGFFLR